MSYPIIFRERVIEYRKENHTLEETSKVFKVSISTISNWEHKLEKEGNLENKELNRSFKKIDPEKLKEFVKNHPDAYLKEIAEEFKCGQTAIRKALKKQKITRKKNKTIQRTRCRKSKTLQ